MSTDRTILTKALEQFYDFLGKRVIIVGAGAGSLLPPTSQFKQRVAIDQNAGALAALQAQFSVQKRSADIAFVVGTFEDLSLFADVVYLEFCLHEMQDPQHTLKVAKFLAPDVVVFDHSPDCGAGFLYDGKCQSQRAPRGPSSVVPSIAHIRSHRSHFIGRLL